MIERFCSITPAPRFSTLVACALMYMLLTGCESYRLQGKVVSGPVSSVVMVDRDDPRLSEPGLQGVLIDVTLEPDTLRPKNIGADVTDGDGNFGLPVRETGAGLLEYQASIVTSRKGYKTLFWEFQLPPGSRRMLIIMEEGAGGYKPPTDLLRESIEIGKEITPN